MNEELVGMQQHGAVRIVSIQRAAKLNSLNHDVVGALDAALSAAVDDPDTRVIILAGAGEKAFVAGMDVEDIAGADAVQAFRAMQKGQDFFRRVARLPKPTIAMVQGYALGGGFELALSCDFIVAGEKARFGFPEITLATFAGWGGTQLAMARMHPAFAREMLLSGSHYTAEQCRHFGFINRIVPQDSLQSDTLAFAALFADKDPVALEFAKTATLSAGSASDTGMLVEAGLYAINFVQPPARAAFENFLAARRR
ncbi:enoyl-CoA hydratase/isomerase family protein [Pelagibacterium halotolerans]|uniref:Enoyl-CoA hydratase n=1 Tax=Pelagibacterium halotolerans (strain DSM 22347 / JCM 15775 / CGMCC 1.7692 / B2) TaxID=1082931 RepID=G4RC65_PELHB|nr:enoyl-CoA hydratase/isomerase family protein [Pelagibacterium halotolerans]AEQ52688.1 enoyl-CoA hydratase [Pelagibacterium halotolerans B2]QJR17610.1 enoyl-CoA hydratase/isomerase family protein [Pelagibacterium halotolerans]SEA84466.1 enoyl-CoA hydratase [Pelagibacterium halotolerans]